LPAAEVVVSPNPAGHRWTRFVLAGVVLGVMLFSVELVREAYVVEGFVMAANSMAPTLLRGDHILVSKLAYWSGAPRRSDIIAYRYPLDRSRIWIHRVIGIGGDTLQMQGNQLWLNGRQVHEPYILGAGAGATASFCPYNYGCQPLNIPAAAYFVLGDNRNKSQDSRYWGLLKRELVVGRPIWIYWSRDPDTGRIRWERVGKRVPHDPTG